MLDDDTEHIEVVRHHNRALRKVHRSLRRALKFVTDYNDNLFLELCDTDSFSTEAEIAMERLWTLGNFDCEASNYGYIVDKCLEALHGN